MDFSWILQLATTLGIGTICYFLKGFFNEVKSNKVELEQRIEKERVESQQRDQELSKQINDLNTSMPFIYVQKEDWIRVSNATDKKIDSIDNKIDKILDTLGTRQEERRS